MYFPSVLLKSSSTADICGSQSSEPASSKFSVSFLTPVLTQRLDGVLLRLFVLAGLPAGHQGGYGESIRAGWELRFRGRRVLHVVQKDQTKIFPLKISKVLQKRSAPLVLNLSAKDQCAPCAQGLTVKLDASLPSCESGRTHVGGSSRTESTGWCASCVARYEAGWSLWSFNPPLIIPVCPPISASASTSLSHCPTAAPDTEQPIIKELERCRAFSCQRPGESVRLKKNNLWAHAVWRWLCEWQACGFTKTDWIFRKQVHFVTSSQTPGGPRGHMLGTGALFARDGAVW